MFKNVKGNHDSIINSVIINPTKSGLLNNLNFAVKDVIDIKGVKTSCGNPTWLSHQREAEVHAICVEQLLSEGAKCIGKTVLGEFCSGSTGTNQFYGMPLNPKSLNRVPGGSSSGSACIVASGEVDFSLGTDAAGSVRLPASFCGIYGMRYSHGLVSMAGVKSFAPSLDTIGVFSRKIKVLDLITRVLIGDNNSISQNRVNQFVVIEDLLKKLEIDQQIIFLDFVNQSCEKLGVKPLFIYLKDIFPELSEKENDANEVFRKILCAEIWTTLSTWIKEVNLQYSKNTFVDFTPMKNINRNSLAEAYKQKTIYANSFNTFLEHNNVLCIPTTPNIAILREDVAKKANQFNYSRLRPFVAISSLGKLPQINIPIERKNAAPFGASLISAHNRDRFLIKIAERIES